MMNQPFAALLVAIGAVPGALLRWQLELVARASGGSLRAITSADLLANLIGCLCLGLLLAASGPRLRFHAPAQHQGKQIGPTGEAQM
jgi:fluoride ion exporter CrcB/FEX